MNIILSTMRNSPQLTCVWVRTGDTRTPLACVWKEAPAPVMELANQSSLEDDLSSRRLWNHTVISLARRHTCALESRVEAEG
jgi:hypothetical protein